MGKTWLALTALVALCTTAGFIGWAEHHGHSDSKAPTVVPRGAPAGAVSGRLSMVFAVQDHRPGLATVELQVGDGPWRPAEAPDGEVVVDLDLAKFPDGVHAVRVRAVDRSWRENRAQAEQAFTVDNTAPDLSIAAASRTLGRGQTGLVLVQTDPDTVRLEVATPAGPVPMTAIGDGTWRGLIGAPLDAEASPLPVSLTAMDGALNVAQASAVIQIVDVPYPRGGFVEFTDDQIRDRRDQDAKAAAEATRTAVLRGSAGPRRWTGPFSAPTVGRISSAYGRHRAYNDGTRSHHDGLDIAAMPGTPVTATADGVVALAEPLHLAGNVILIDHGDGVFTGYDHLRSILVAVGDPVEQGDHIGEVGETGLVTGPHLHWSVFVGGVAVDPNPWLTNDFASLDDPEFEPLAATTRSLWVDQRSE